MANGKATRHQREHSVLVIWHVSGQATKQEERISGFSNASTAKEYAKKRVRASVEILRKKDQASEELLQLWREQGSDVSVDGRWVGRENIEAFIAQPASDEETDYRSLEPLPDFMRNFGRAVPDWVKGILVLTYIPMLLFTAYFTTLPCSERRHYADTDACKTKNNGRTLIHSDGGFFRGLIWPLYWPYRAALAIDNALMVNAAKQGDRDAQYDLGQVFYRGEQWRFRKDRYQAFAWFLKSAQKGHSKAQAYVGYMYDNGIGTQKNSAEAARFFQLAAEQSNATAQLNLAIQYRYGRGIEHDPVMAYVWYSRAADQGEEQAKRGRQAVAENMTAAQLQQASRRLREPGSPRLP